MLPLVKGIVGLAAMPLGRALGFNAGRATRAEEALQARELRAEELRREAMRAMHEALDAAENARRVREEFLARMSHELRTPLNAVIGFARVLEKNRAGNQRPEDIELLARVRDSGERLLRLVEGVLDQVVLQGGRIELDLADLDVAAVTASVVAEFDARATAKGIRAYAIVPDEPCLARLDAVRFGQILYHLVDNAVKFTAAGQVSVVLVTDAATRRPARLVVSDTGIGIPSHQLERIFTPFEQADASRRRIHDGVGLGLPLARQLCEAMGCCLAVDSTPGVGSRFTLHFPG